jgi:acyl dehydratase
MSPVVREADVTRVFESTEQLEDSVGQQLGYSDWVVVDQDRIDRFADATGDYQWIHVDPERAAAGPFGGTIAHGYLSLSMIPTLVSQVLAYSGWSTAINYGSDKVRFPAPVPVGSRVRAGVELLAVRELPSGIQVTNRVTVEIAGSDRPAVVAETITLLVR